MLDLAATLAELRAWLTREGTPERAQGEKAYLKSDLSFYGVGAPGLKRLLREFSGPHRSLTRAELVGLVKALWETGWFEDRALAVGLLERYSKLLVPGDMGLVEGLLRRSHTWALVDFLSTKVSATLVQRFPECRAELPRWGQDGDFWVQRAAMLSLLPELRKGGGDWPGFVALAVPLLGEKEFFLRKAIGWVLREVSKKRPELVFEFLATHRTRVSGLTLREGAKYLGASRREALGLS